MQIHLFKRFLLCGLCLTALGASATDAISLAGTWRFQLDRADVGLARHWFDGKLPDHLQLPGALQNQGFGDDITVDTPWTGASNVETWRQGEQYAKYRQPGNIKVPFCLQPEKHYVGAAWYQRDFHIPAAWAGRRVFVTLERAHWETRLWVDGREVGANDSLSTPHTYELGVALPAGRHTLTARVDNRVRVKVGDWAHSVSDHTQGNWNGLIGRLEVAATSPVWIADVQVFPDVARKAAHVRVRLGNATGRAGHGTLSLGARAVPVAWEATGASVETSVALDPETPCWDEFSPRLQTLALQLSGEGVGDARTVTFGLREITTDGKEFRLNGHPVFFRGTLECCIFPLTGYPPTDVADWKRIITVCKAHGLNLIRFHSWCPPEAAFVAADELGFYFQVECAVWTNPGEDQAIGDWIYAESRRIVAAYGNHPSFVLLTHGNEPHGPNRETFLTGWVNYWKEHDARRLVTSGSAYPQLPENQFHVFYPSRGPHGWLGKDYRRDVAALTVPAIVHEMGQWCAYPNFEEISRYTGPLKARSFEIFRDSLTEHGMIGQWRDFLRASGKLQTLCYKEEIEAALRTPGLGGFELLDLHDFPGQGTALVGVLGPFWNAKGYVTPAEYRRFCNSTVPLARVLKRVWTSDETFTAAVEAAHFGPHPLTNAVAEWKLVGPGDQIAASGVLVPTASAGGVLPLSQGLPLGEVSVRLAGLPAPQAYKLVVGFRGTPFENDWNLWVYPPAMAAAPPADVWVTSTWDDATLTRLNAGGKVVLLGPKLAREHPVLGFEPVFWNRYMFNSQSRQTLGLLCDPKHPALAAFPTRDYQDWQWNDIVTHARATVLEGLPSALRPIVQVIDDWNTNRKLGLVWEGRVGAGKLLVCSADLTGSLDQRPAARQLRASLLAYAVGKDFKPRVALRPQDLARLFNPAPASKLVRLGAKLLATDSEDTANGNVAARAIDGDPESFWHTRWTPTVDPLPHHLTIDLGRSVTLKGVTYLPRQDQANGRIGRCEVYTSLAADQWGTPAATVKWSNTDQRQTVRFAQPTPARYLKLIIRSEVAGQAFASIAELDVLTDD